MFRARKPCQIDLLPLKFRSLSDSEHFDNESRDYLLSNSRENQSEDDSESTDDGFDRFTNHQVHLSASPQWLCSSCMTFGRGEGCFVFIFVGFFFLLLIEIISIAKLLIIVHLFVLKHEKQTVGYIHQTKCEGSKNIFFSPVYFVGEPVFLPHN